MDKFILLLKTFFVANKTAAIAVMAGTCAVATVGGGGNGCLYPESEKGCRK